MVKSVVYNYRALCNQASLYRRSRFLELFFFFFVSFFFTFGYDAIGSP